MKIKWVCVKRLEYEKFGMTQQVFDKMWKRKRSRRKD
jgi:hypothetical protein